jgi:N-acyl-L-homoserine lactone synthetase
MSYSFRPAGTSGDFEQIRSLNHQIFSEELGQHALRPDGLLADPFEARSRYLIALHRELVVGMVCVHDDPPWSVARRLADPAILAALPHPLLEVRLLALHPAHRSRLVLAGLLAGVFEDATRRGHRTLIISGVTSQVKMYRRLGFAELGPAISDGDAAFYPMALDLRAMPAHTLQSWRRYQRRSS